MALQRSARAVAVTALLLGGCSSTHEAAPPPSPGPEPRVTAEAVGGRPETLRVAPYIDVTAGPVAIDDLAATGQTDFTLAYLQAPPQGACDPAWGGRTPLADATVTGEADRITGRGGNVVVATGGPTGTYLESVCSEEQLAGAYRKALDAVGANRLDVDLEQQVTVEPVIRALTELQEDRDTAITLTLPVAGVTGFGSDAITMLKAAADAGLKVTVNALTMNFNAAGGGWGRAMTLAAGAARAALAGVWPDKSVEELWEMFGVTPMIGVNGTGGTTKPADAAYLLKWAKSKGVGFVRFWSVNRDTGACGNGTVAANCSGIIQTAYQFTIQFQKFSD
ncbi:lysozyme [Actinoplanes sp. SE50]|uniref:lysozyme n=1 Tax=unclassified Actinoplanes TaxID=2626549 RepID=UPI00023EE018|nr:MULTISPECIES: lysozyme [unclassified Actinoplanes]AEV88378.1 lysozyme [Actinoplanes sp. SE50/110]ATO86783.1 lysozyme [Actinoplanes sp. SE50]SLM04201.1 lysozyme [Actinoplanes sp. SE50/110]